MNNNYQPSLATLNLPGGSVQVPQDVFNAIQPLLFRNDSTVADLQTRADALSTALNTAQERLDAAEASLEDAESQIEYKDGVIEALRDRLDAAEKSTKGKGKKKNPLENLGDFAITEDEDDEEMDMEEDMDMDDEDMDTEEEEEPMPKSKSKKSKKDGYGKGMKKDSIRADAIALARTMREAEQLGVDLEDHFDSIETADDIRRIVVETLAPHINLDDKSDGYIHGLYDSLTDAEPARTDSVRTDYAEEMSTALSATGRGGDRGKAAQSESAKRRMENFRSDLTASKGKYGRR